MFNIVAPALYQPKHILLESGFSNESIIYLTCILFLILSSALMSGSEVAFFSLSPAEKDQLNANESKSAVIAQNLLKKPQELLATLLIFNNFVNVGIVILSTALLQDIYPPTKGNETVRLFIEVVGITLTILFFGEVLPKIYSSRNTLPTVLRMANTLHFLNKMPPFSWLKSFLVQGSNLINKNTRKKGIKISTDELEQALALTKEDSTSQEEHKILEGIIRFGNTEVCQIMKSRMDVIAIEKESDFVTVHETILECGYSRIPVYEEKFDNVIGILFIKDILSFLDQSENPDFKWLDLLHKPFFVPENKKIDDLLKEFQEKKVHMAVIVDEYGGANGICTLEDILEEIVGDITDEYDEKEIIFSKLDEDTFVFEGRTALVDFYKVLDIDGREFELIKGDADSLGGFMVENAGRILHNNEYIIHDNIKMIVESSDKRRIKTIRIIRLNNKNESE